MGNLMETNSNLGKFDENKFQLWKIWWEQIPIMGNLMETNFNYGKFDGNKFQLWEIWWKQIPIMENLKKTNSNYGKFEENKYQLWEIWLDHNNLFQQCENLCQHSFAMGNLMEVRILQKWEIWWKQIPIMENLKKTNSNYGKFEENKYQLWEIWLEHNNLFQQCENLCQHSFAMGNLMEVRILHKWEIWWKHFAEMGNLMEIY